MQPTHALHGTIDAPLEGWKDVRTAAPEQAKQAVILPEYPLYGVYVVPVMPTMETTPLGGFKKPQPVNIMDFMKGGAPYGIK